MKRVAARHLRRERDGGLQTAHGGQEGRHHRHRGASPPPPPPLTLAARRAASHSRMQIVGFKQLRSNRWVALRSNHLVSAYGGWGPCVLIGIPCNYYLLTKFIVSYGGLHAPRRAGLHADGDRHVLSGDRRGLRRRALHRLDSIVCCLLSLDGGCVVEEGGLYWQVAGEGSVAALSTALCDIMPPKFKSRCASKSRQAFQSLRWRQHHGVCQDAVKTSSSGCFPHRGALFVCCVLPGSTRSRRAPMASRATHCRSRSASASGLSLALRRVVHPLLLLRGALYGGIRLAIRSGLRGRLPGLLGDSLGGRRRAAGCGHYAHPDGA